MSLIIADALTRPIQIWPANQLGKRWLTWYMPAKPSKDLENLETLLDAISGEFTGLIAANRMRIPSLPFHIGMLRPGPPVNLESDYGGMLGWYQAGRDDGAVGLSKEELDSSTILYWSDPKFPIPDYGAIVMMALAQGRTGNRDYKATAAPNANKISVDFADAGDSAFTEGADNQPYHYWFLYHACVAAGVGDSFFGAKRVIKASGTPANSETMWTRIYQASLFTYRDYSLLPISTAPIYPELQVESPAQGLRRELAQVSKELRAAEAKLESAPLALMTPYEWAQSMGNPAPQTAKYDDQEFQEYVKAWQAEYGNWYWGT
jgi:hypothetical protein